jgi:hypothetical protein
MDHLSLLLSAKLSLEMSSLALVHHEFFPRRTIMALNGC